MQPCLAVTLYDCIPPCLLISYRCQLKYWSFFVYLFPLLAGMLQLSPYQGRIPETSLSGEPFTIRSDTTVLLTIPQHHFINLNPIS